MGSGFVARLTARRDATAESMRNAMTLHVPAYAAQPSSRHAALLEEVHDTWRPVLMRSVQNEPLTEADLEPYRALARKRAASSFALRDVRTGFEVAHTTGLRECLSTIETGDGDEPIAFIAWGVRELPRVMGAVEGAYVAACSAAKSRTEARELLLDRLVTGKDARETAASVGIELPSGYLVLLCRRRFHENDSALRRSALQGQLAAVPGLLWRTDPAVGGLLILLPVHMNVSVTRAVARDLTTAMVQALGQRLNIAEAHADKLDAVPAAVREAQQALTLVTAMPDAENRPYSTDELLVELAVARQPALRERLTGLLAPLQQGTDLRRTLEALFDCGLDRQRTTAALHIHRRSLTYRIQRIRELTGLDPSTAHGIQLLRAALTASRLPAASGAAHADPATGLQAAAAPATGPLGN